MLKQRSFLSTISFAFVLIFSPIGADAAEAKLSLVIDDICGGAWPASYKAVKLADAIPVALSVMPNGEEACRKSLWRYKMPKNATLMLHMPMQPKGHENPGDEAILASDDETAVERKLNEAWVKVPSARGINNHMGSAVTNNEAKMRIITAWAADRNLFYIDSATAPFHACKVTSGQCARNDMFLDNKQEYRAIADQLEKARKLSLKSGRTVIVIGHPHPKTIEILNAYIRKNRVKFVPVKDAL